MERRKKNSAQEKVRKATVTEINNLPAAEKSQLTGSLIQALSQEDNPEKRQTVLETLGKIRFGESPLVPYYLRGVYVEEVTKQTQSPEGTEQPDKIDALIEAGKILRKVLPKDEETRDLLATAWEPLSETYPDVRTKVTELYRVFPITKETTETAAYARKKPNVKKVPKDGSTPSVKPPTIKEQVCTLITEEGLSNEELGERLGITKEKAATKRWELRKEGRVTEKSTSKTITAAETRREAVLRLAKRGKNLSEIARLLGEEPKLISRDWTVLNKRGELDTQRRGSSETTRNKDRPWYHPTLTKEQEYEIFTHLKQGGTITEILSNERFMDEFDTDDREKWADISRRSSDLPEAILRSNRNLVYMVAKRFLKTGLPIDDIMSTGNIGLIKAIRGFDPERGNKFSTYAVPLIKSEVKYELCRRAEIPRGVFDGISKARLMNYAIKAALGEEPTHTEIRSQLIVNTELSLQLIEKVMAELAKKPRYLNGEFLSDEEGEVGDKIEDASVNVEDTALGNVSQIQRKNALHSAMQQSLTAEELTIIHLAYGINNQERIAPQKIAQQTGKSLAEINEIIESGFAKLRQSAEIQKTREEETPPTENTPLEVIIYEASSEKKPRRSVQRERVKELRNSGQNYSNQEIADELGISLNAVRKHITGLYKEGVIQPRPAHITRPQRERVKALRNLQTDYTNKEIADELGISLSTVQSHIKNLLQDKEIEPKTESLSAEQRAQLRESTRSPKTDAVARWLRENKSKTKFSSI